MRNLILAGALLMTAGSVWAQPDDAPKVKDARFIKSGILSGKWTATLVGSKGSRTQKVELDVPGGTMNLGGQVITLTRDGRTIDGTASTADMLHVTKAGDAIETTVNLTISDVAGISGTYRIKQGKKVLDEGTIELSRPVPKPPKAWKAPELSKEDKLAFDPGPPKKVAKIISEFPGDNLYTHENSWINFGPKWYRGRAGTGEAKVLVIASDPGPDEAIVGRTLVGDAGKRVQGLLTKIGLTENYVLANAHPYAVFPGKAMSQGVEILKDPALTEWRNKYYDALIGDNNHLEAIIVLGLQAQTAADLWTDKPNVPVILLPHPSNHDEASTVAAYRAAVPKLRRLVTPDADAPKNVPNYGTKWDRVNDYTAIPRRDLPFGALYFTGMDGLGNFAKRPDGDEFRNQIVITAPYRESKGILGAVDGVSGAKASSSAAPSADAPAAALGRATTRGRSAGSDILNARLGEARDRADGRDAADER